MSSASDASELYTRSSYKNDYKDDHELIDYKTSDQLEYYSRSGNTTDYFQNAYRNHFISSKPTLFPDTEYLAHDSDIEARSGKLTSYFDASMESEKIAYLGKTATLSCVVHHAPSDKSVSEKLMLIKFRRAVKNSSVL